MIGLDTWHLDVPSVLPFFYQTSGRHNSMIFLVSYVGERPQWPIQSPNKEGSRKEAKG